MKKILTICVLLAATLTVAQAGGLKYSSDDAYLKLGGRLQLQYKLVDPEDGDSTDELFFRRLRPYIEGSVHKDWMGKWQFDLGKGTVELKDCYAQYKGWSGAKITIGNANAQFSRELLTSSKYQQLVERTFVGDHNYGVPDRQTGVHLTGDVLDKKVAWGLSLAKAAQDPSNSKIDFEPVISLNAGSDWSEGEMVAGRVDFHPFGPTKFSQGDFKGDLKMTIGVGGYAWQNDEDNLDAEREDDVDSVAGLEISGALRVAGLSVDAQYNRVESELVDPMITDGLYVDSETTLQNWAVEGGYMVWPDKVELVAGYQSQDADGYAENWTRTSVGANLFANKHNSKCQVTYRMGKNKDGKDGNDVDELFVQYQYVF